MPRVSLEKVFYTRMIVKIIDNNMTINNSIGILSVFEINLVFP